MTLSQYGGMYIWSRWCGDTSDHALVDRYTFLAVGWAAFAFVAYKVSRADIESKVYNPFEILGINTVHNQLCQLV